MLQGFIIGGALAQNNNVGFVSIRKGGKLLGINNTVLNSDSFNDYSSSNKSLKINKSSITSGDKILLVDEWIETGTQMKVAIQLIEQLNGEIVDITTLCAETNKNTLVLFDKYNLHAISVSAEME